MEGKVADKCLGESDSGCRGECGGAWVVEGVGGGFS